MNQKLLKQTFTIGSVRSSGSNMTDLEQTFNEPLIFLERKYTTLACWHWQHVVHHVKHFFKILCHIKSKIDKSNILSSIEANIKRLFAIISEKLQ